jgi:hypothetical protein
MPFLILPVLQTRLNELINVHKLIQVQHCSTQTDECRPQPSFLIILGQLRNLIMQMFDREIFFIVRRMAIQRQLKQSNYQRLFPIGVLADIAIRFKKRAVRKRFCVPNSFWTIEQHQRLRRHHGRISPRT